MSEQAQAKKPEQSTPTLVIVTNNQERLETIHVPADCPSGGGELMSLVPGVNLVNSDALKWCRKNKQFDGKFTTNIPRHVADEARSAREGQPLLVQGKEVPAKSPLAKLSSQEAIDIVKDTNTEELLVQLKTDEHREDVRSAILNRVDLLKRGGEAEAT